MQALRKSLCLVSYERLGVNAGILNVMVRSVVKISTGPVRQSQGLLEFSAPELGHSKGLGGVRQVRVKP